jgi:hypothetical protein
MCIYLLIQIQYKTLDTHPLIAVHHVIRRFLRQLFGGNSLRQSLVKVHARSLRVGLCTIVQLLQRGHSLLRRRQLLCAHTCALICAEMHVQHGVACTHSHSVATKCANTHAHA